ncbi:MAG: M14 family zinc carboxypeptidase [Sediminibacterium sp.]|nr:M14 family zinc carboxypeptidase [Sediminibacterium sp.]
MKKIFIILCTFCYLVSNSQSLKSPDEYLGYALGSKYTLHYKIVNYFNYLHQNKGKNTKIINYGETYEGRPLMVMVLGNEKNIQKIEELRQKNYQLAHKPLQADDIANYPVMVWLSYNVHGNEPASSEAAMKTAYYLLNESHNFFENSVVILDPCINPDGRDRYVNWVTGNLGRNFNPQTNAREHNEANPSGRTNHYYFDLNRDWCWQSQIESQQRIKLYNQWLPHIHVDYHEQGPNEPYYFAPAANPYHAQITQFQRDFQIEIGKNNASYFDKHNWLFFTRERFDLLYPSYGDTYPTYLGAIGMTYEQGGISGALGVITEDEDTLTLAQRLEHHFTTSISTIEVSAKNAKSVLQNFQQFYKDNNSGNTGSVKSFVFTANNQTILSEITELLDKNYIEYGQLTNNNFNGVNVFSNKEESFKNEGFSLVVNLNQCNGRLARILLEPETFLADSNTYDITSWALPYNYGVTMYSVNSVLPITEFKKTIAPVQSSNYGYIIPYNSFTSGKILAKLLTSQIKVRFSKLPLKVDKKDFSYGSLIILATSNPHHWAETTRKICQEFNVEPTALHSGLIQPNGPDLGSSDYGIIAKAPRVGVITSDRVNSNALGEIWHFFDYDLNYPITILNYSNNYRFQLQNIDILIIPDGSYDFLNKEQEQFQKIKNFIENGGKIICLENGAWQLAKSTQWSLKLSNDNTEEKTKLSDLVAYENAERNYLQYSIPGAIYKVNIDKSNPLCYSFNKDYYTLKQDDKAFELNAGITNIGNLDQGNYITGFSGKKVKEKLNSQLGLFGTLNHGRGTVVFFNDDIIFRQFWESGKRLLTNALFFAGK